MADGALWLSVAVKAAAYAASLLAAGLALYLAFERLDGAPARAARRLAVGAAVLAAALTGARLAMRASFLGGGGADAAMDPMLLGIVIDSPLGDSAILRWIGLGLIATLAVGEATGVLAALGAVAVALSFAAVGHALAEPRALLGALVTLHLLAVAWWIGALAPLARLARDDPAAAGAAAERFGRQAGWVVALLALAGAALFVLLTGAPLAALATPYGQLMALKLIAVAALLGLAALNKLRLSPALAAGRRGAATALRRSIAAEALVVLAILTLTAAMTTVASPTMDVPS